MPATRESACRKVAVAGTIGQHESPRSTRPARAKPDQGARRWSPVVRREHEFAQGKPVETGTGLKVPSPLLEETCKATMPDVCTRFSRSARPSSMKSPGSPPQRCAGHGRTDKEITRDIQRKLFHVPLRTAARLRPARRFRLGIHELYDPSSIFFTIKVSTYIGDLSVLIT